MAKTLTDEELLAANAAKLERLKAEQKALKNAQRNLKNKTENARQRKIGEAFEKLYGKKISNPNVFASVVKKIDADNNDLIWKNYVKNLPLEEQEQEQAQKQEQEQKQPEQEKKKGFFGRIM